MDTTAQHKVWTGFAACYRHPHRLQLFSLQGESSSSSKSSVSVRFSLYQRAAASLMKAQQGSQAPWINMKLDTNPCVAWNVLMSCSEADQRRSGASCECCCFLSAGAELGWEDVSMWTISIISGPRNVSHLSEILSFGKNGQLNPTLNIKQQDGC